VRKALATAVLALALWSPAVASAHAVLEDSQPSRGAALERAPERISVTFDEPVESSFGALRVFDASGKRVDAGEVTRPSAEALAVRTEGRLADGPYTVTYRVVSADSHPVSGGYVFTVGEAAGATPASVAHLLDRDTGPVTEVALGMARGAGYGATALLAGGLAFLLLVWLPALRAIGLDGDGRQAAVSTFDRRALVVSVAAACVGVASVALGIVLQGATASGGSFWAALDARVLADVLDTRFGTVWKLRLTAFGLLLALLLWPRPAAGRSTAPPRSAGALVRPAAIYLALAYLVVSPALSGHAAAGDRAALLVTLDSVHVAAMSAWVGGVALLVLAVPSATRVLEPADRTRLLAAVVARFSTVALVAVGALLASGVLQ